MNILTMLERIDYKSNIFNLTQKLAWLFTMNLLNIDSSNASHNMKMSKSECFTVDTQLLL